MISVNIYSVDKEKKKKHSDEEKIADVEEDEGGKRKTSCKNRLSHERKEMDFIDDEAVLSGNDSEDEEESATMEDAIEDLINDRDDISPIHAED